MSRIELSWPGKASAKAEADSTEFSEFHPVSSPLRGVVGARLFPSPPQLPGQRHVLLEGDNLHALRALHAAGVDYHFIYIDPPYNSGQTFTFRDSQGGADPEAAWLGFMYARLVWARRVLRHDGVLFVSIDDRQHASLALLLSEIFGKENHVATLKWRKKRKPSFLDSHCASIIEYILVFARDAKQLPRFRGEATEEVTRPVLNAANGECVRLLRRGTEARCPDGRYAKGAYVNRTLGLELLDDARVVGGCLASEVRVRGRFRVSQDILDKTVFLTPQFGLRRHVLPEERSFKHITDDCTDWPTNEDAEAEIRRIFGARVFDYAKPVGLVRNLLAMCPVKPGAEFRCLDFFAGSGTLAEAVLAQNAADGGARLFTCVQSPDLLVAPSPGLGTIFDITLARANFALRASDDMRPLDVFSSSPAPSVPLKERKHNARRAGADAGNVGNDTKADAVRPRGSARSRAHSRAGAEPGVRGG
jgi:adenine-specific DNA-methyltransferase